MEALKMTWSPHHEYRRRGSPPLGLKNLGNSCYLNSVLQCLSYTPPLAQFCLSSQHSSFCRAVEPRREEECPFCVLELQIARCLSFEGTLYAPSKIQKCLSLFAAHFKWGRQEDAHEFLRYVIDACHSTCLKLLTFASSSKGNASSRSSKEGGECTVGKVGVSIMKDIFGGVLLSQVKCLSCQAESNKTDEMMDISLDILQSSSLKEAMSRFFQTEVLDGNNKYFCGICKKLTVARKQMFMFKAPNVLVIQLKRFEGLGGGKINKNIDFEEVLMLSKFMFDTSQDRHPEYNLFGSIVHSGFSPDSGHYYAYIKDASGCWYCCNDAHVTLSSTQEVLSEKVYILFYLRNIRRSSKIAVESNGVVKSSGSQSEFSCQNSAEVLKTRVVKLNGVHPSKQNSTSLSWNGKVSPKQPGGSFNMTSFQIKRGSANGNFSREVLGRSRIENESVLHKENKVASTDKLEMLPIKNSAPCYDVSSNGWELGDKFMINGSKDNHTQHGAVVHGKENGSNSADVSTDEENHKVVGSKRKSVDVERAEALVTCDEVGVTSSNQDAGSSLPSNVTYESHSTYLGSHLQLELEKFKEELADEARSNLLSCDWAAKVHEFMRARKKSCAEAKGAMSDNSELKAQLVSDAKKAFVSQIPESLKKHLVERLVSFNKEKQNAPSGS